MAKAFVLGNFIGLDFKHDVKNLPYHYCSRRGTIKPMSNATLQVQKLYERRPYPHYPLLAKPRWQDGYLGSSLFAHALLNENNFYPNEPRHFLSVGSGEILPYILRQWEPSATRIDCVDLSQRSIRRAQFRTALLGRPLEFHAADINELLRDGALAQKQYDHMEAYGVLHHIPKFSLTLRLLSEHLESGSIMRVMVYNASARDWIWQLNRAFSCLDLRFESDTDVHRARQLLKDLAKISPRLAHRLSLLGETSLENNTRFADTFLHPWESRASIKTWFKTFSSAELQPVALFDRYAELDDLPNPLWRCPTEHELSERAADLRFENNLELWLRKKGPSSKKTSISNTTSRSIPMRLRLTLPPVNFRRFEETSDLTLGAKLTLWQGFLKSIYGKTDPSNIKLIEGLDRATGARLARLGLILPKAAQAAGRYDDFMAPIAKDMAPPILPEQSNDLVIPRIETLCSSLQTNPRKLAQCIRRIMRVV